MAADVGKHAVSVRKVADRLAEGGEERQLLVVVQEAAHLGEELVEVEDEAVRKGEVVDDERKHGDDGNDGGRPHDRTVERRDLDVVLQPEVVVVVYEAEAGVDDLLVDGVLQQLVGEEVEGGDLVHPEPVDVDEV